MSADSDLSLPDSQAVLLPAHAYLLSLRDQNLPLRRLALEDAEAHFASVDGTDLHKTQLATVAAIGEALQILEDVAALGHALVTSPLGLPFYVSAASYSPRSVNNFYSGLKNRSNEELRNLLGMSFGTIGLADVFVIDPPLTEAEHAAVEEADAGTVGLVREHLLRLAGDWERYRRFFHAFKHGLPVVNPHDGWLVEDRSAPVEAIVVWRRRSRRAQGHGAIEPPYAKTVDYVCDVGRLALEILEYLTVSRLRFFEMIEFRDDGSIGPCRRAVPPWHWWFREGGVSPAARSLLSARFGMTFA